MGHIVLNTNPFWIQNRKCCTSPKWCAHFWKFFKYFPIEKNILPLLPYIDTQQPYGPQGCEIKFSGKCNLNPLPEHFGSRHFWPGLLCTPICVFDLCKHILCVPGIGILIYRWYQVYLFFFWSHTSVIHKVSSDRTVTSILSIKGVHKHFGHKQMGVNIVATNILATNFLVPNFLETNGWNTNVLVYNTYSR